MPLFGVDISHYQAGLNLSQVKAEGFDFAVIKASEGTTYKDPSFPGFLAAARAAGLLVAAYHYVDSTTDAGAQARFCANYINDKTVPVMLDHEKGGGTVAFLRSVGATLSGIGQRVALSYVPKWYWTQLGSPTLSPLPGALVASSYPSTSVDTAANLYRNVTPARWAGYGGMTPSVLQFSDRATVAGQNVDVDAFLGTRDELAALLNGTPATRKADDLVQNFPISGSGTIKVICPTGSASTMTSAAWLSASLTDGTGTVKCFVQSDKGGLVEWDWTLSTANGLCPRQVGQLPDGATQVTVDYALTGHGGLCLETEPK